MNFLTSKSKGNRMGIFLLLIAAIGLVPAMAKAEYPTPDWVVGPAVVALGDNLAELSISDEYIFAGAKDTREIMEYMGNPLSNHEIGYIAPNSETANWFIVFDYLPIGYVKDDEKNDIDAEAILDSIIQGTEKANEIREKNGFAPLTITGWHNEPYYDTDTNNLTWTLLAEQGGTELVNHNVRILGRHGYISIVLVADVPTLEASRYQLDEIVSNVVYKEGKSYAEYVQGDKVAKYGLTALIAGGAAATAAKFGLFKVLAKFWKIGLIAVFGLFAALKGKIASLFGGKRNSTPSGQPNPAPPANVQPKRSNPDHNFPDAQ
jgi:uncharacterized membrane-anchored protein